MCYYIEYILIHSNIEYEQLLASNILANLSYNSDEIIFYLKNEEIINDLINLAENHPKINLIEQNLLILFGNILSSEDEFIIKKTRFLEYFVKFIEKNFSYKNTIINWIIEILLKHINLIIVYLDKVKTI